MNEFAMTYRVKSSGYNARVAISKFVESAYQLTAPDKRGADWYQHINNQSLQYLKDERDHSKDLILYIRTYESSAPKTIWKEVSFIKLWLESNDIEIKKSQFRMIRVSLPHNRVISEEDEFSHEIARRCMSHMHQPLRAITLMLMSSGMRIGELLQLEIIDLDLESSPVTVTIQSETTKTKTTKPESRLVRITFIENFIPPYYFV